MHQRPSTTPARRAALAVVHGGGRRGRGADEAAAYLAAFGTFHMCVRLGLILKYKERGEWWDAAYCLERDKIGVTRAQALLTARRAARWAGRAAPVRSLAPWFVSVAARIEEM